MEALFNFIISCGIGLTFFLIVQLLILKKKSVQDKILVFIFLIILVYLLISYTSTNNYDHLSIALFLLNDPIEFLLGTFILLYVKSFTSNSNHFFKDHKHYFIPTLVYYVFFSFPIFVSYLKGRYLFPYLNSIDNTHQDLFLAFLMIFLNTYIVLALREFYKYQRQLKNHFSTIHRHNNIWIKRMLISILVVCFIDLGVSIIDSAFNLELDISDFLTPIASVMLMYYLGYNAVNKTQLLAPIGEPFQGKELVRKEDKQNAFFTADEVENHTIKIKEQLRVHQLFLDENLDLKTLAKAVGISDKKLSTFINQELKTTFYDLINFYRIEAVKQKLSSPDYNELTIIAIANDCGFKSKTTFNRIFKKETQLSPSVYKKKYQKSSQISAIASFEPLKH